MIAGVEDRTHEDGNVELLELLESLREGDDLSGAHEGEVKRIEEEDHVLALIIHSLIEYCIYRTL